ncbi:unnamed protein product [Blepharisma stoltei]|uniref:Mitochondrial import inner membrane translocase subunit n=1 Tax=Blepharisma stoltei TaxID=1481888 RepID=A0AAU9JKL4_9CILI|nr:unnamed protein product [Blepharisma stoltei]
MEGHRNQGISQHALQEQAAIMQSFARQSHKCFMKCVQKPSRSLSSTEDRCLTNCVDRFYDTQQFLIERLQGLAQKEQEKAGMVNH